MVFFTRELYNGVQPDSTWQRRAMKEWERRSDFSRRYEALIAPFLPASIVRLCRETLHDAIVKSVGQRDRRLAFVMDARRALGGFAGRRVRLEFNGVRRRISTRGLIGHWWLYEEVHLCSRARFALHVLFDNTEIEIEADGLRIKEA